MTPRLMKAVLIAGVISLCIGARATTYYASSTAGSDTNSGLSPATAWKSIARVNQARLRPGDSVLFRRGDLWHETLRPESSGSAAAPITLGAYGEGAKPVISGSDPVADSDWRHEGETWVYLPNIVSAPASLWDRGVRLIRAGRREQVQHENEWWYDEARHRVYLRSARTSCHIEIQVRDFNIDDNQQSHVVYDGLDLRHGREGLRLFSWRGTLTDVTMQNSAIATEPSATRGTMSAGVYASVEWGTISAVTIRNNVFTPYPAGLEHWGIYFVQGVTDFTITGNQLAPGGEDAITIWHCAHGVIAENSGGGNGENTIDVKDSQDVLIRDNHAVADGEYSIVVHSVDAGSVTSQVIVQHNRCERGGQARQLTAGIALLFVRDSVVRGNTVEHAYGAGVFVNDREAGSGNEIAGNSLKDNGTDQSTGAITLEDVADVEVHHNIVDGQGAGGFAVRIEGGPHTQGVRVHDNLLFPGNGRMVDVADAARGRVAFFHNTYFFDGRGVFRLGERSLDFSEWQKTAAQDAGSREMRSDQFANASLAAAWR